MSSELYDVLVVALTGTSIAIGVVAWRARVGGLMVLGEASRADLEELRKLEALKQYRRSFALLFASGLLGLCLWGLGVLGLLFGWGGSRTSQIIALAGAAGQTALFRFLMKMWRECRNNVMR